MPLRNVFLQLNKPVFSGEILVQDVVVSLIDKKRTYHLSGTRALSGVLGSTDRAGAKEALRHGKGASRFTFQRY